jgi:hypothetical protein
MSAMINTGKPRLVSIFSAIPLEDFPAVWEANEGRVSTYQLQRLSER